MFCTEHHSYHLAPPARPRAQPRLDERLACEYRSESNDRKRSVDEHGNLAEEGGVPSHTQSAAVRIPEVCRSLAGSATSHPSSAFDMRLNYARSEQIPTKNHRSDSHRVSVTTHDARVYWRCHPEAQNQVKRPSRGFIRPSRETWSSLHVCSRTMHSEASGASNLNPLRKLRAKAHPRNCVFT